MAKFVGKIANELEKNKLLYNDTDGNVQATDLDPSKVATKDDLQDYSSLPVGTIVEYEGETVPDGYELVDGSEDAGDVVGTVLYNKESGTTTSFVLSQDYSNFTRLDVVVGSSTNASGGRILSLDLTTGASKYPIDFIVNDGTDSTMYHAELAFSGTSVTVSGNTTTQSINGEGTSINSAPLLAIYKVIGFKGNYSGVSVPVETSSGGTGGKSLNAEFKVYNMTSDGTNISEFIPYDTFISINCGDHFDYTRNGVGRSEMVIHIKEYTDGNYSVRELTLCTGFDLASTSDTSEVINFELLVLSTDTTDATQSVYIGGQGAETGQDALACFTGDTLVLTENGSKAISELSINDNVITYNKETNEQESQPITAIISHNSRTLYTIETEYNELKVTGDHPVHTAENGSTLVEDLKVGLHLLTNDNRLDTIKSITKDVDTQVVYDIGTANGNYYVGTVPVLVYSENVTNSCK